MNNCEEFTCPSLDVPLSDLKEALRCVVYTILFNRAIGGNRAVEPITVKSPQFDVAYAKIESAEVDAQVEAQIKSLAETAEAAAGTALTLVLAFYLESPTEAGLLWQVLSGRRSERTYFERWKIPVNLQTSRPSSPREADFAVKHSSSMVKNAVWFVLRKVCEKMDHLPSSSPTPIYPVEIYVDKFREAWSPRSLASSIKSIPFLT